MSDVDALIQMCCACPAEKARRLVLADKLQELGESECEEVVRSDKGEALIRSVYRAADQLKREPCLHLLWAVGMLVLPVFTALPLSVPMPIDGPLPDSGNPYLQPNSYTWRLVRSDDGPKWYDHLPPEERWLMYPPTEWKSRT